jgi:hypothetical protein
METRNLIVGAGPYGLAIAHELWRRGVDFAVVGEPFETWHRHTLSSMTLRSDCRASALPARGDRYSLVRYLERNGRREEIERTPVTTFRRYLRAVTEELPFPVVRDRVTHLARQNGGFVATGPGGTEVAASTVVVATGLGSHRYLPPPVRDLPAGRVLHSWQVGAIEALDGERVLVIGTGQSAAETVAHLRDGNRVTWALRREPLFFREPLRLPTPLFKAVLAGSRALYRLPPAVLRTVGRGVFRTTITPDLEPVYHDPAVTKLFGDAEELGLRATPDGVFCDGVDGDAAGTPFDRVIAATGYRYTVGGLPFLDDELAAELGGRLDADFRTAVPGLHLVGGIAEPTFGPAMRFILGARHAARRMGAVLG